MRLKGPSKTSDKKRGTKDEGRAMKDEERGKKGEEDSAGSSRKIPHG